MGKEKETLQLHGIIATTEKKLKYTILTVVSILCGCSLSDHE